MDSIRLPPTAPSAKIALERLFWITGADRYRTRDPRVLWCGEPQSDVAAAAGHLTQTAVEQ